MILHNVIKANFLKQEKHSRFFRSLLKVKKLECLETDLRTMPVSRCKFQLQDKLGRSGKNYFFMNY